MKQTDVAWAAGIVDGEGCISIIRSRPNRSARGVSQNHRLMLKVAMGHRETVLRLREILGGGTVHRHVRAGRHCNASYQWAERAKECDPVGVPYEEFQGLELSVKDIKKEYP